MADFAAENGALRRLLVVAIGLAISAGCKPADDAGSSGIRAVPALQLTIISPHSQRIRDTFAEAFSEWHDSEFNRSVAIDWIVLGTPQCVEYIDDIFEGRNIEGGMKAPDLMFGGGIAYHRALAERDRCFELKLGDALEGIPADIHGLPTRDQENRWVATGLSSFGILYNAADCKARGIEPPATWSDLADPRFAGWLAIADPAKSGSYRQSMMLILQHQGWDDGWGTLVRILANARALESGSARGHDQIESGVMLGGFAVNFDGLRRVQENPDSLAYVNPPGASAVTPDVVSVVKTAADARLAEQFVRFCLSEQGQAIWSVDADGREESNHTLYHYPIKPSLYESQKGKLAVEDNPFETDFGIQIDLKLAAKQAEALVPLTEAMCNGNHILLQQAWAAVQKSGMNETALAKLCEPIVGEQEAFDAIARMQSAGSAEADAIEKQWAEAFRARLKEVIDLAADAG